MQTCCTDAVELKRIVLVVVAGQVGKTFAVSKSLENCMQQNANLRTKVVTTLKGTVEEVYSVSNPWHRHCALRKGHCKLKAECKIPLPFPDIKQKNRGKKRRHEGVTHAQALGSAKTLVQGRKASSES